MKKKQSIHGLDPCVLKLIRIMKLTVFLMLMSLMGVFASETYSQNTRLTLNANKMTLEDFLLKIENQSEFRFFYTGKIDVEQEVTGEFKNKKIFEILDEIKNDAGFQYEVLGRQIILSPNDAEGAIKSIQQQKSVSGKVTDSSNQPLPGVTVVVKGTTTGTVTNTDGSFTISNISDEAILQFSFVGMKMQEIAVGSQTNVNVLMVEETIGLDEVVAVGYGSAKRSDISGAISTIKNEDLTLAPVTSPTNALAGRVPGLQTLQGSGEPGADASRLSIRGFGDALIIVDGVEQSFNNISAAEIESISVLKDASAAIYGARAGNGVILITTKRGNTGKPTITFNSSYTLSGNINYPKPLTAGQYTELYRESQVNSGVNPASIKYSEQDIKNYYAQAHPDSISTDWWSETMNDWAPMQQYDLSLQGGGDNIRYYAFTGYTRQDGMFKTGDNTYDRFNVRSNIDAQVTKNVSMELNLSAIVGNRLRSAQGIEEGGSFWNEFFWAKPTYRAFLPDPNKTAYSGGPLALNPVINTNKEIGGYNQVNAQDLRGTLALKFNIPWVKGLYLKAFGDYHYLFNDNKTFSKFVQTYSYNYAADAYKPELTTGSTTLSETMSPGHIATGQFSVNYNGVFNEKHDLTGLFLYEMISSYGKWMSGYRRDFLSTAIDYLFAGNPNTQQNNGSASEFGRASYVGRLNYKYNNKYLAEVTLRYDGSPNFPEETRWGLFPSISAGWVISEESFVKDRIQWMSYMKLRASFSNTGYDDVGAYQYIAGYTMGQRPFALNGLQQTGIASSGIPNPNITWEQMTTYNLGLDFGLFNNTVYGEADVFYRLRDGILGTRIVSLPSTFGATLPSENINSMDTRGFEFLLGFRKNYGDLSVDVSGNISWARSKWVHYDEPDYTDPDDIKINKKTGTWTDLIWGYQTDKLFTSQSEIDNLGYNIDGKGNSTVKVGDIKYLNLNGDDKLDWRDYTVIGYSDTTAYSSGLPKTMFGLQFKLVYKNFDLDGLMQGATGRSIDVHQGMQSEQSVPQNIFTYRWTEENPDVNALFPRQSFSSNNYPKPGPNGTFTNQSDFWFKDGTYLRLKVISIGYNFASEFVKSIGFENIRLYLSGTNLFTVSGLKKYNTDPETYNQTQLGFGFSGAAYPHQRTISAGLNLSF